MTAAVILQKVKVQMKDYDTCKARYAEIPMLITDTTFCASADGKDACQVSLAPRRGGAACSEWKRKAGSGGTAC